MMADDAKQESKQAAAVKTAEVKNDDNEHYEVVSEYRIGEGAPPLFLIICFILIVLWAMFSWIPFFGY
jgi:hypothetical protein